jgi:hypothetical protein
MISLMLIHVCTYMFIHYVDPLLLFYEILNMYSYVIHFFNIMFRGPDMHIYTYMHILV